MTGEAPINVKLNKISYFTHFVKIAEKYQLAKKAQKTKERQNHEILSLSRGKEEMREIAKFRPIEKR